MSKDGHTPDRQGLADEIEMLLSRGLDADLDRVEMRSLYRLAAERDSVRARMGELANLEDGLQVLAAAQTEAVPQRDFTTALQETAVADRPNPLRSLWQWFTSPHGIAVQPLSFAAGAAIVVVGLSMVPPTVMPKMMQGAGNPPVQEASAPPRFMVNPVQFVDAKARVEWTYQFIVPAAGASRIAIDHGDSRPVTFQFESAEATQLRLIHRGPGQTRDLVQSFHVDGIGIASLANPQPGDAVTVHNDGNVPVLVYAHTGKADVGSVSRSF